MRILRVAPFAVATIFLACSFSCSSSSNTTSVTNGADSGSKIDASVSDATSPSNVDGSDDDASGPGCNVDRPSNFDCAAPTVKPGETVCDDVAINALASCFQSTGTTAACNTAKTTYPACAKCMTEDWVYTPMGQIYGEPDTGACMLAIEPTSTCGKAARCEADCYEYVCGTCNATPGSGTQTGSPTAQYDCEKTASGDQDECYDIDNYVDCAKDAALKPCIIYADVDFVTFFRGACRDNGTWTNAANAQDGGSDAGAD